MSFDGHGFSQFHIFCYTKWILPLYDRCFYGTLITTTTAVWALIPVENFKLEACQFKKTFRWEFKFKYIIHYLTCYSYFQCVLFWSILQDLLLHYVSEISSVCILRICWQNCISVPSSFFSISDIQHLLPYRRVRAYIFTPLS